ncbi:MAG: TRAP transporter fused permease subunit [Butyrivibrio sp.]|nr:TRAP transporter fused permease subunit [Butyrivibrio sp.]
MEELQQPKSKVSSYLQKFIGLVAIATGLMHILNTAGVITLSSITLRVLHLGAMMCIVLIADEKNKKYHSKLDAVIRGIITVCVIACSAYLLLVAWPNMIATGGSSTKTDAIMGLIMCIVLLETCRRYLSPTLTIVAIVFLLYPFVCSHLFGVLKGRTYSFTRVFTTMFSSTNSIYGIPLGVSATYIVMFCIFGSFLKAFGTSDFMYRLSSAITRGMLGATAKTAVVFSLLIGMITGSPAGNVAITGSMTIPLMKSRGYPKEKAAAYESVASTGGPLMPPVMGSAAFLMAEITGIRYASIAKAALLPALLYFLSVMFIATNDCRANNIDTGRKREPEDETVWQVLKSGWANALPMISLIVLLVAGYSPLKSAFFSSIILVVVYVLMTRKINKELFVKLVNGIRQGVIDASTMAVACATSGIVVGILSMTGLGSRISTLIITISQGQIMLALVLVMLTAIVLGMGLPTSPAYLVLSTVAVPALVKMGLPILASHLFVFFFAAISAITPPVALASYVAAGIADANLNKVGWIAFRWGITSFILPYMFILSPALLLDGPILDVILVVVMGIIGVFCLAIGIVGFWKAKVPWWQRIIIFACGLLLIDVNIWTDVIGIAGAAVICLINYKKGQKNELRPAEVV